MLTPKFFAALLLLYQFDAFTCLHSDFDYGESAEEAQRPNYALSFENARLLANTESQLVSSLLNIKDPNPLPYKCSKYLQKYLAEYNTDVESLAKYKTVRDRVQEIVHNPLYTYKMIRRLVVTLLTHTIEECGTEYKTIRNLANSTFKKYRLELPSKFDLDDAALGILRIQYVYGLNATSELIFGVVNGISTGSTLYFDDCVPLFEAAIEQELYNLAAQWITAASSVPQLSSDDNIEDQSGYIEEAWQYLSELTHNSDRDHLRETLLKSKQRFWRRHPSFTQYSVCRGEYSLSDENRKNVKCYLDRTKHPYFAINPLKIEQLSFNPPVEQFYEVISNSAIKAIWRASWRSFLRSGTISHREKKTEYDTLRVSMNGWIYDTEEHRPNERLKKLISITELITSLNVYERGASQFQVLKYSSLGGHYVFHEDSIQDSTAPLDDGERIATFMMFFADVKMGGYTGFPKLGTFAKPVKGSAVLWYNVHPDGRPDRSSLHGGCPVVMGVKQVANRWIMGNANMWKYPCRKS